MAKTIVFRCPHRGSGAANLSSAERRAKRRESIPVPVDTEWRPVKDVRMGDNGVLETFDVGTSYALVTCPVCGDKKKVVTDEKVK